MKPNKNVSLVQPIRDKIPKTSLNAISLLVEKWTNMLLKMESVWHVQIFKEPKKNRS